MSRTKAARIATDAVKKELDASEHSRILIKLLQRPCYLFGSERDAIKVSNFSSGTFLTKRMAQLRKA